MIFVDTNYFLRYFRDDIPEQSTTSKELFKQASIGKIKLFTSTVVFFEVFWVMDRFYKYDKSEVNFVLSSIIKMKFINLEEKDLLFDALKIYKKTSLELEDCYNIAFAKSCGMREFATFDKKLRSYLKK